MMIKVIKDILKKRSKIVKKIKENYTDFYWWRDNMIYYSLKMFEKNKGDYIFDDEWDNLIILDDCRFDMFKEIYEKRKMKGILEQRVSRGTWTVEFLIENFYEKKYDNIVYITANPYIDMHFSGKFHKIISVWKTDWNNKYKTVLPSAILRHTINALNKYPNKKLIIHFLQPHHPYFTLNFEDTLMEKIKNTVNEKSYNMTKDDKPKSLFDIYSCSLYSSFSVNEIINAYKENLKLVIPYVEWLLNILPGRTIITSDHGESFGDKIHPLIPIKFYGHGFTRLQSLTLVPWLIVDKEFKIPYREKEQIKYEISKIEKIITDETEKTKKIIKTLKNKQKI